MPVLTTIQRQSVDRARRLEATEDREALAREVSTTADADWLYAAAFGASRAAIHDLLHIIDTLTADP